MGINKINICTDLFIAATEGIMKADLKGNNCKKVYNIAKQSEKMLIEKYIELFGARDKAWEVKRKRKAHVITSNDEK